MSECVGYTESVSGDGSYLRVTRKYASVTQAEMADSFEEYAKSLADSKCPGWNDCGYLNLADYSDPLNLDRVWYFRVKPSK